MSDKASRVIIALDFPEEKFAWSLVDQLSPADCRLKVGKEMFTRFGPAFVKRLIHRGFDVFLDLKFHDIPNTVAAAVRAAADLGVWMLNVHALGGAAMLEAARDALEKIHGKRPLLLGVTVLTSHTETDLRLLGFSVNLAELVLRLADLVNQVGLDGVVCSAQEAHTLRKKFGEAFVLVTPGIRFGQTPMDDQQRIITPKAALRAGADYLVIGRPITRAEDPLQILKTVNDECA